MITIYVYDKRTNIFKGYKTGPELEDLLISLQENDNYTTVSPTNLYSVCKWNNDTNIWVNVLPINNPNIQYDDKSVWNEELTQWIESPELAAYMYLEEQAAAWENIKKLRYEKITGGVFIPSLNKWVHTDEAASTQYALIGLRIMQGTYTPIAWKAMDNTFIQLTEEVFIELQERMMEQTQTIHAKAEYHKLMMEASENPLEYDYTTNWK